jgi:hypothetical protein
MAECFVARFLTRLQWFMVTLVLAKYLEIYHEVLWIFMASVKPASSFGPIRELQCLSNIRALVFYVL